MAVMLAVNLVCGGLTAILLVRLTRRAGLSAPRRLPLR
jgi:hypothetical protein